MPHRPTRSRPRALALLVAAACLPALPACGGEAPSGARAPEAGDVAAQERARAWASDVRGVLEDYCLACHGGAEPEGGLDLEPWAAAGPPGAARLRARADLVERLAGHVGGGLMPPPGEARPRAPARAAFAAWWTDALAAAWAAAPPDPGRVTLRRLNRYEYQRTVRDLLGVDFDAAAVFPSDDVGYGFDHIGDVLSMPPLLLEKYLAAAEEISARAVLDVAPGIRRFEAEEGRIGRGGRVAGSQVVLTTRGDVAWRARFARSGRYVLRVRAFGQQAGPEPAKMVVRLDGGAREEHLVEAVRAAPAAYETIVDVEAGSHRLAAAFVNDYYRPDHPDRGQRDRNLWIDWLEIEGPLAEGLGPLPATHRRNVPCEPAPGEERACAERFVRRLLRRAFRRPPSEVEVERHVGLVLQAMAAGERFHGGLQVALQAVLVSPHFLFRVELDERSGPGTRATRLGDHALASRLAYFLWSSLPDEALDARADAGTLRAALHDEVTRMLADQRADALVENFAVQWLELRRLETAAPDPQRYAAFDEALRASMRRETELLFATVVREDRSILDLLDAPFTFVDERLARHYGLTGVEGEAFRRVELVDPRRGGLLGHASILTLTSYPTRTSPVQRGKWLMEEILGTPPPPPPPGVGALEAQAPELLKLSLRERLQKHREDATCAVCHDRMDNLGYGLECFDAVGAVRARDGPVVVDSSGVLPDGRTFDGPAELRALLRSDPGFPRCFAEKLLTYALGRGLEPYDRPAVLRIVAAARERGFTFSSFVHAVVASDAFTMRRTAGAPR